MKEPRLAAAAGAQGDPTARVVRRKASEEVLGPFPQPLGIDMPSAIQQAPLDAAESYPADLRSDEALLLQYRAQGDRQAFAVLVYRYQKELFSYLRHYLGDAEMAEDVFQQTFLKVHLKCGQFAPGRRVRPWLYTVATNQAIDFQRRSRRHRAASLDRRWELQPEDQPHALVELADSSQPDPGQEAERAERRRQVRQALGSLPESARQVVILVYVQGLKYREAADVLSIPLGTLKGRLYAALEELRQALARGTCEDAPHRLGRSAQRACSQMESETFLHSQKPKERCDSASVRE